jgi:hypothetical protein
VKVRALMLLYAKAAYTWVVENKVCFVYFNLRLSQLIPLLLLVWIFLLVDFFLTAKDCGGDTHGERLLIY